jgi:EAL domain-containing protein (putative c-di-GMP-specific phosphodiesterase class I)/GGDEF domain-containing protein
VNVPPPPNAPPALAPEGLPETRDALLRLLDRETAIARATDGRLAVLLVELRRVDRLHALLKGPSPAITVSLVLERLRKAMRPEDRVAAFSEDQVCIVLPRLAHPSQAVLAAVKVLRCLDRPIAHEGGSAVLRPCVGVATLPEHGLTPAELLSGADVSRHIAATREEGYHVYQPDDMVETEIYRGLDLDLERAIRANELVMHYQPQIELASGRPIGVEALLRWTHATAGEVAPLTIIGIAERTGLIGSLTFWVLNAALRQAAAWRDDGMVSPRLAINLAVRSLIDRELPGVMDQTLRTWGVPAHSVTLEIAESAMIADAERSVAILTRLKAVGLQIAIDDFGSGFTSLSSLKRFPIDTLKIDKPFVQGLLSDPGDRAVVRSAIDLAHHFGLQVAAEGVEREDTREALAGLGCDLAQGNAICPPLSNADFREWWAAHRPDQ